MLARKSTSRRFGSTLLARARSLLRSMALCAGSAGRTTTYGALAQEVEAGREAARDVGEAMARNPAPFILPCHRVLAAGGKIGGFSAPGGSKTKARTRNWSAAFLSARQKKRSKGPSG